MSNSAEINLLTSEQVCEKLSINRTYLYRLIHKEKLPYYGLGHRTLRFKWSEVKSWLENRHDN